MLRNSTWYFITMLGAPSKQWKLLQKCGKHGTKLYSQNHFLTVWELKTKADVTFVWLHPGTEHPGQIKFSPCMPDSDHGNTMNVLDFQESKETLPVNQSPKYRLINNEDKLYNTEFSMPDTVGIWFLKLPRQLVKQSCFNILCDWKKTRCCYWKPQFPLPSHIHGSTLKHGYWCLWHPLGKEGNSVGWEIKERRAGVQQIFQQEYVWL